MLRKTTPTHTFKLPFAANLIESLEITYSQFNYDKIIVQKYKDDVTLENDEVVVKLTSEETAASSSTPSAIIFISVPLIIPYLSTFSFGIDVFI